MKQGKKSLSYFYKIFLSFLAITALITFAFFCVTFFGFQKSSYDMVYQFYSRVLEQTNYSVTYVNGLAKRISSSLFADNALVNFLYMDTEDNLATLTANNSVRRLTTPLTYVESVYLYNAKVDLLLSTRNGEQSTLEDFYDEKVKAAINNPDIVRGQAGKPIVHTVNYNDTTREICSYILFDTDKDGKMINALVINIHTSALINSVDELTLSGKTDSVFLIADDEGRIIGAPDFYSDEVNRAIIDATIQLYKSGAEPELFTVEVNKEEYLSLYSSDNPNGWIIIGMINKTNVLRSLITIFTVSAVAVVLFLGLAVLLSHQIAKRLNSPLKTITGLVKKSSPNLVEKINDVDEFEYLTHVFTDMKTQNEQFEHFRNDAEYTIRQNFLHKLFSGTNIYSMEKTEAMLKELNIEFIKTNRLCICVMKIDAYKNFTLEKNLQESWAYRYAITNIVSELLLEQFDSVVTDTGTDRFAVLINCDSTKNTDNFFDVLLAALRHVQEKVLECLNVSLTIAYSDIFKTPEALSVIYESTAELLLLKMHLGAGKIISAKMAEDLEDERSEVTLADEDALRENLLNADFAGCKKAFACISKKLSTYSCSEVAPFTIHLAFVLYNAVKGKYPLLRDSLSDSFRECVAALSDCELMNEISEAMCTFFVSATEKIYAIKETSSSQNNILVVARILDYVEENLSDKNLCLNLIAEEIGLSANYIGVLFKAAQGVSVAKFVQEARMEHVVHYMKTTKLPLAEILDKCGLELNNYFYTTFKKHFGMSMGKYRLTVLNIPD